MTTWYVFDPEDAAATVWWPWAEWSGQGPIYPLFGRGFDNATRFLLLSTTPWTRRTLEALLRRIRRAYAEDLAELEANDPGLWERWRAQWREQVPAAAPDPPTG
jgi:hypothetical protein